MMRPSEKQKIQQMREGRADAFEWFVDTYGGRIHSLTRRYARTEADAEDLTQEIFLDLCRGISSFRGDSALSTWIYRIAVNHCLKYQGRLRPENVALDDEIVAVDTNADPVQHAARRELAGQVEDALAELTPGHRDVVILHELNGLTYAECAVILSIPVGTVKSRLSNAFGRLRNRLSNYVLGAESNSAPASLPERERTGTAFYVAPANGRAAK